MTKTELYLNKLILIVTVFSLIVIALGAYTRLVHAGLGCPDWPLCYGHAWAPSTTADIAQANVSFPEIPVNLTKTWPEMTHRYLASSLGALCILIVAGGIRLRRLGINFPIKHSVFLLIFIIMQGMFGMWTVTLKLWPQVVTLHLLGGFSTFCLLLLLHCRHSTAFSKLFIDSQRTRKPTNKLNALAIFSLTMVIVQVALGGWVTSNYAALACVDLPWCDVSGVMAADLKAGFNIFQEIGPNYLGGQLDTGARISIHVAHRLGALIVTLSLSVLIFTLISRGYRRMGYSLAVTLALQVILGLCNIYFHLPLFNAVAHNIVGALLVGVVVLVNWSLLSKTKKGLPESI